MNYTNEQFIEFLKPLYEYGKKEYKRFEDWNSINEFTAEYSYGNFDDCFTDGWLKADILLAHEISEKFPEVFPKFWKDGFFD